MAASMPPNAQAPITPPPELRYGFGCKPELHPTQKDVDEMRAFAQSVYGKPADKVYPPASATSPAAAATTAAAAASAASVASAAAAAAAAAASAPVAPVAPAAAAVAGAGPAGQQDPKTLDPRYLTMVTRIAAYYQQRSQAVANYQQQRCQAWANMQRQKCQEMMQAAMLVVAWYIRDRIQRRRRKQRRQFRKGLSARCGGRAGGGRVTKGERVRRWVLGVPEGAPSSAAPALADRDEAGFSMDKEPTPDKDTRLFNVADNMIKSQLSRIDVPLMGTLSFGESESESEDEEEEEEEEEDEDEELDDIDDIDDELLDDDDDDDDDEPITGSEHVHHGTGDGSRKRSASSS